MNKSSLYLGVVISAGEENAAQTVRYHSHGPDYHELDYEDVVAMEGALAPLATEYDALALKACLLYTSPSPRD